MRNGINAWQRGIRIDADNSTYTPMERYSPLAIELATRFQYMTQKELGSTFVQYYNKVTGVAADMFDTPETLSKEQAVERVFGINKDGKYVGTNNQGQPLFSIRPNETLSEFAQRVAHEAKNAQGAKVDKQGKKQSGVKSSDTRFSVSTPKQLEQALDDVIDNNADNTIHFSIGKKARAAYENTLRKHRPDMSENEIKQSLDFLHSLDESKENTKRIKVAVKWMADGSVQVPKDFKQISRAIMICEIAGKDPMQYKSPTEVFDDNPDIQLKEKPIDPDTVPTLSNKREYAEGVTVYDVEDSEESRQNMREVINTHFGLNASPWCLLAGDGNGNLTENSGRMWQHYNSIPKKVAFKNGHLLAFCAHDYGYDDDLWWNRQDEPSNNIPLGGGEYLMPDGDITTRIDKEDNSDEGNIEAACDMLANEIDDDFYYDICQRLHSKIEYEGLKVNHYYVGGLIQDYFQYLSEEVYDQTQRLYAYDIVQEYMNYIDDGVWREAVYDKFLDNTDDWEIGDEDVDDFFENNYAEISEYYHDDVYDELAQEYRDSGEFIEALDGYYEDVYRDMVTNYRNKADVIELAYWLEQEGSLGYDLDIESEVNRYLPETYDGDTIRFSVSSQKESDLIQQIDNRLEELNRKGESTLHNPTDGNPNQLNDRGGGFSSAKLQKIAERTNQISKKVADFINNFNEQEINAENFIDKFVKEVGINDYNQDSKYAYLALPNGATLSLRLSDHNVNLHNYKNKHHRHAKNYSVVIRLDGEKRFKAVDGITMQEYVYDNPTPAKLKDISKSIFGLTAFGEYVDIANADEHNISPQEDRNNRFSVPKPKPSDIRFSISNRSNDIFYSNAERAVEQIKQEKATPEQWRAMIEKAGGLKAGEDKWIGLSDFLNHIEIGENETPSEAIARNNKRTITKQEILDFIRQNKIQIEETHYQVLPNPNETEIGREFLALRKQYADEDKVNGEYQSPVRKYAQKAFDKMVERYGDDFEFAFYLNGSNRLSVNVEDAAFHFWGIDGSKDIYGIRLRYTTQGLENKREIALTVPTIESWNEGDEIHFGDAGEGRAIAWVRFGDATDNEGNKVLVIDEIQSKRHQEGREFGYTDIQSSELRRRLNKAEEEYVDYLDSMRDKYGQMRLPELMAKMSDEELAEANRLDEAADKARQEWHAVPFQAIPSAPFEKNWHELAMKRILRFAAENGYDKVAWTTGNQQAERYNLGKYIDKVVFNKQSFISSKGETTYELELQKDGRTIETHLFSESELPQYIGKESAKEIIEKGSGEINYKDGTYVGGEGMRGFYDDILPRFMQKYGKKWGAQVGEVTMPQLENGYQTMHSVDITDPMRESVMQGQPMFSISGKTPKPIGHGAFGDIYDQFKGKPQEAFDFLVQHKSGDLLGVFHDEELGDVDLVWGSKEENAGLEHIIDKHIGKGKDFATIDEARQTIENVINNGNKIRGNADKVIYELDGKRVVVRKNLRNKKTGELIYTNKNWVVTSYDNNIPKSKKSGTSTLTTPESTTKAGLSPSTDNSADKGTTNFANDKIAPTRFSIAGQPTIRPNETIGEFSSRYNAWLEQEKDKDIFDMYANDYMRRKNKRGNKKLKDRIEEFFYNAEQSVERFQQGFPFNHLFDNILKEIPYGNHYTKYINIQLKEIPYGKFNKQKIRYLLLKEIPYGKISLADNNNLLS